MTIDLKMTRRHALKTTALLSAGTALPKLAVADSSTKKDGWIDAHSHIWTRDVRQFPLAEGQTVDDLDPPSFTAEELIKTSEPHGVKRVVLIQHHIYHGWDNSYMIDAADRYPDQFRIVGMVDDTTPHPDAVMKKLLPQKVTAFRITPWIRGSDKWLDGPGMADMWKCSAETGQAMCCLIDANDLASVDAMCRKFPQTKVVIDHFARIGVDGKIRDKDVKQLCSLSKHKNTHLKISAYYALGKKQEPYHDLIPMIRRVLDVYGPERCMWASDAPYQVVKGHSYGASIDLVKSGLDFISDGDKDWLLRRTAQKVYWLDS